VNINTPAQAGSLDGHPSELWWTSGPGR